MAVIKFKVTKSGEDGSGILTLNMFKDHFWLMEQPVSWFPGILGTWVRMTTSTKFHSSEFIRLLGMDGDMVAQFGPPPYTLQQRLVAHGDRFGGPPHFDLQVVQTAPLLKPFRIRELSDATYSFFIVGQAEFAVFEIEDPATGASASYLYEALGLGLSLPKFKPPAVLSAPGPWNDFMAPGYMGVGDFRGSATMQTFSVAAGTSVSYNVLDIHVDADEFGNAIHIDGLSTGVSVGVPGAGVTTGRFVPAASTSTGKPQRLGGCGKFGCNYSSSPD
jgi:hypothetical protein